MMIACLQLRRPRMNATVVRFQPFRRLPSTTGSLTHVRAHLGKYGPGSQQVLLLAKHSIVWQQLGRGSMRTRARPAAQSLVPRRTSSRLLPRACSLTPATSRLLPRVLCILGARRRLGGEQHRAAQATARAREAGLLVDVEKAERVGEGAGKWMVRGLRGMFPTAAVCRSDYYQSSLQAKPKHGANASCAAPL